MGGDLLDCDRGLRTVRPTFGGATLLRAQLPGGVKLLAGFEGVGHEHGDGHGTDSAGDGGDGGAFGGDLVEGDVTDQAAVSYTHLTLPTKRIV